MDWIHQHLFYEFRWLWLIVCLAGFVYAGFLYYRSARAWLDARAPADNDGGATVSSTTGGSTTGDSTFMPPTSDADVQQDRLLDDVDSDTVEPPSTRKKAATEKMTDRTPHYPIDGGATTKISSSKDPQSRSTSILKDTDSEPDGAERLRSAIQAAVEDTIDEHGETDSVTDENDDTIATAEGSGHFPADGTDDDDSSDSGDVATATADEEVLTDRYLPRNRHSTHTEILRKAARHEELGLHIGIGQGEDGEAALSNDEKAARLRELGLAGDAAETTRSTGTAAEEGGIVRRSTSELDDILGRLDQALGDGGEQRSESDEDLVVADDDDDDAEQREPTPLTLKEQNHDPLTGRTTQRPDAGQRDPESEHPHEKRPPSQRLTAEFLAATENEQEALTRSNKALSESEIEAAAAERGSEDQGAAGGRQNAGSSIPAWARADTFDDDASEQSDEDDDESPEQQKLF